MKKVKCIKILLTVIITTLISFTIRYLGLKYFNLDILRVDLNPFYSFLTMFGLNGIRLLVRSFLDEYIPHTLSMNISDILNTPSPEPANPPSNNQGNNQNNPPSNNQGDNQNNPMGNRPYALGNDGRYYINDPTGVGNRGYIDPSTNRPYLSNQPYARNLASAMEDYSIQHGNPTVGWSSRAFDDNSYRFFSEYMGYHHPSRTVNQQWNSGIIRKNFRDLN